MKNIILATGNQGKINELKAMLPSYHCISQRALNIHDATEDGLSFIENAIIKARHASHLSSQPALADDSGLVVPALNGAPGIYSARFAGQHANDAENIQLLLARMANIPEQQRQAYFYCAIVLIQHVNDPTPMIATGTLSGHIAHECLGDNGFGYDPVFYLRNYQCTLAQLPAEIKNKISHRAIALNQLQQQMTLNAEIIW